MRFWMRTTKTGRCSATARIAAPRSASGCNSRGIAIARINRRKSNTPLTEPQKQRNKRKSRVRARVEHVFGRQAQFACHLSATYIRCIGLRRARAELGLRNLVYNLDRYTRLAVR